MKLFFGKKTEKTPKDAIIKLRETLIMLEKRENFLNNKIDTEQNIAKLNAAKNKKVALAALRRKKQYEAQIDRIMSTRTTIETQMLAIESAKVNLETMDAMKQGASAMKDIHKNMNIDKVDETMDDIRDQIDNINSISEAISTPIGNVDYDEDELMDELNGLEEEILNEKLDHAIAPTQNLPTSHIAAVQKKVQPELDDEEAELEQLRASMAI